MRIIVHKNGSLGSLLLTCDFQLNEHESEYTVILASEGRNRLHPTCQELRSCGSGVTSWMFVTISQAQSNAHRTLYPSCIMCRWPFQENQRSQPNELQPHFTD